MSIHRTPDRVIITCDCCGDSFSRRQFSHEPNPPGWRFRIESDICFCPKPRCLIKDKNTPRGEI